MKRLPIISLLILLAATASAQVNSHRDIKTPPLRKFETPQPKRIALPTGMVIFPGGVDIHTHVAGAALNFARIEAVGTP